jgi:hypothetical protein
MSMRILKPEEILAETLRLIESALSAHPELDVVRDPEQRFPITDAVRLTALIPDMDLVLPLDKFSERYLSAIVAEIMRKIAEHPGKVFIGELECPPGLCWSERASSEHFSLRLLRGYDLVNDRFLTTFDFGIVARDTDKEGVAA